MRSCGEYELLISAFLDGALSGEERVELADHLTACPACQQYFDDLVAMHDAFDREEIPVPEGFAQGVMSRVRETPQSGKVIHFPRWRRWTALAACCALVAVGVWSVYRQGSGVASQTAMADSAMVMSRSAVSEDAGTGTEGGVMLMMDDAEDEAAALEPEAPEEKKQTARDASSNADGIMEDALESASWRDADALNGEEADSEPAAAIPSPASTAEKESSGLLSEEDAWTIALSHAGLTAGELTSSELKLDREDGRQVYEIDFRAGATEYDYEIDSANGDILKHSMESDLEPAVLPSPADTVGGTASGLLSEEDAWTIALAHAGLTAEDISSPELELDLEDGRQVYKLEFRAGAMEYEYEIDPVSGDILEYDVDAD